MGVSLPLHQMAFWIATNLVHYVQLWLVMNRAESRKEFKRYVCLKYSLRVLVPHTIPKAVN